MVTLTVACKADHALLLPTVLAATYARQNQADNPLSVNFEDTKRVGPTGEYLKLVTQDGTIVYDQTVCCYLREHFPVLQLGNSDQVCNFFRGSRIPGLQCY